MFDAFKPAAAEKRAIEGAWNWLIANTRDQYRSASFMKQEHKGCGHANDRIPLIAAKGLCLRWFLEGVNNPGALLRDCYYMRPAAIWFKGAGAERSGAAAVNMPALEAAVASYDVAFKRMQAEDGLAAE